MAGRILRTPSGSLGSLSFLLLSLLLIGAWLGAAAPAGAMPTQTQGAGSAVGNVELSASFDTVSSSDSLAAYTEDGLSITVPDTAILLTDASWGGTLDGGHHAPSGGSTSPTVLRTTDGAEILGIEFRIASGWSTTDALVHIDWQIWTDSVMVGFGNADLARGTVIGFRDPDGFDELHIGAYQFDFRAVGGINGGLNQALGVDDVAVQVVPEPASALLLGLGLVALGRRARPRPMR